MPIPFLVPAGMMAVRIGGRWVLKKIVQRAAKKKAKEEAKKVNDYKARDARNAREADKRKIKQKQKQLKIKKRRRIK